MTPTGDVHATPHADTEPVHGRHRSVPRRRTGVPVNIFMARLVRHLRACVIGLVALPCAMTAAAIEPGMPNPPARPTRVRCAILIVNVIDIDDVSESFEAKISLVASWHDPRLAFDAAAEGTDRKLFQGPYQFSELFRGWWPQLVLVNEVGLGDITAVKLEVAPDGGVRLMQQRTVRLETPMQLHDYPFDRQRLQAALVPFGTTTDEVVLEVDERYADTTDELVRRNQDVNVAGWILRHLEMVVDETFLSMGNGRRTFSRLLTTIHLERRSWQLVWQLLFPLVVIVSMIWSVFWIDPESLSDRLNVSFIGVLTIVAYQFVVIDHMPRMSYLTFTDTLLLVSFVTMSATIPQSLAIDSLVRKGHTGRAQRIDHICRWAFPLAYLIAIAATIAWFSGH